MFLVVVTSLPDHEKWLDALEAAANDYCCTPVDASQFAWLVRRFRTQANYSGRVRGIMTIYGRATIKYRSGTRGVGNSANPF